MQIQDTPQKFGIVSKLLHWIIGLMFIFQFFKVFDRWNNKQNFITEILPPWHGSIGTLLMFLVLIRIFWMIVQFKKRGNESILVKAGHILLYVFMSLAPLSAISLMLSKGRAISIFGYEIIAKGEAITNIAWFGQLHSPIALILIALVIGHIGMAIAHQFGAEDKKVLQKMV